MKESPKESTNAEKFVILAEKRVQKALDTIESIGKLSNRSNYSYTDDQVKKIKAALIGQVNSVMARFAPSAPASTGFSLK
jgi:hypothetical protein